MDTINIKLLKLSCFVMKFNIKWLNDLFNKPYPLEKQFRSLEFRINYYIRISILNRKNCLHYDPINYNHKKKNVIFGMDLNIAIRKQFMKEQKKALIQHSARIIVHSGVGFILLKMHQFHKNYAYILNQNDDFRYQGKQVFLLCLVCIGKTIQLNNSNSSLRRAPDGYDCVLGGGNQFILYGMDVRRAYPAFEVIFE